MALFITRRAGESFSVFDRPGARWLRCTVMHSGAEPLLRIEAPSHLIVRRDDEATGDPSESNGSSAPLPPPAEGTS